MTSTTAHLRWVDDLPPPGPAVPAPGRIPDGYAHAAVAETLRSRPGWWAMLPDLPQAYSAQIAAGVNVAYRPGGSFEAVSRQGVVYARYVGGG